MATVRAPRPIEATLGKVDPRAFRCRNCKHQEAEHDPTTGKCLFDHTHFALDEDWAQRAVLIEYASAFSSEVCLPEWPMDAVVLRVSIGRRVFAYTRREIVFELSQYGPLFPRGIWRQRRSASRRKRVA